MVEAFISSEKVAVTFVPKATFVAPAAGAVLATVGFVVSGGGVAAFETSIAETVGWLVVALKAMFSAPSPTGTSKERVTAVIGPATAFRSRF